MLTRLLLLVIIKCVICDAENGTKSEILLELADRILNEVYKSQGVEKITNGAGESIMSWPLNESLSGGGEYCPYISCDNVKIQFQHKTAKKRIAINPIDNQSLELRVSALQPTFIMDNCTHNYDEILMKADYKDFILELVAHIDFDPATQLCRGGSLKLVQLVTRSNNTEESYDNFFEDTELCRKTILFEYYIKQASYIDETIKDDSKEVMSDFDWCHNLPKFDVILEENKKKMSKLSRLFISLGCISFNIQNVSNVLIQF